MSANDAFEAEAELFLRDTGFLAPGKSEAAAACGQTEFERDEVRRLMKNAWNAGRKRGQIEALASISAPAPSGEAAGEPCSWHKRHGHDYEKCLADHLAVLALPAPSAPEPCGECATCRGRGFIDDEEGVTRERLDCRPADGGRP